MSLSPMRNGEIPLHDQYERTAEAMLNGHLYINYEDSDPALAEMDNPYNPEARTAAGVRYHHDNAYYKGHYYMYFGVLPVILVFLPFPVITGSSLTAYHGTQIFALFFVFGLFMFFMKVSKLFFKKLSFSVYVFTSVAFSFMSLWYASTAPVMYCTAITAALCVEIWSFYFFFKAAFGDYSQKMIVLFSILGSLFGASAFACRPSIAIANLLVIPLLIKIINKLKEKSKISRKTIMNLLISICPYFIIAALLMAYNFARFENPFEFGQAYQLTVADQTQYGGLLQLFSHWKSVVFGIAAFTVHLDFANPVSTGVFIAFPILLYTFFGIENDCVRNRIKKYKLSSIVVFLIVIILAIMIIDSVWCPYILPRYFMDIYWLLAISTFIIIGSYNEEKQNKKRFSFVICALSVLTIVVSIGLFLLPNDGNFTEYYSISFVNYVS